MRHLKNNRFLKSVIKSLNGIEWFIQLNLNYNLTHLNIYIFLKAYKNKVIKSNYVMLQ